MKCEFLISKDIMPNCDDPITGGIEANAVIINRDDIDFVATVFNATRKNVIENLVLKSGRRGYGVFVMGNQPFNNTQTTMEEGVNRNSFTNDLGMVILDNDPDICAQVIDNLANGTFVVVFENKHKNKNKAVNAGDSVFQIMGYFQGLRATTLENNKYSEDTEGGWNVLLQETRVPRSGLFLFNGTFEATRTVFESLTEQRFVGNLPPP